jgi:hypothetical protein
MYVFHSAIAVLCPVQMYTFLLCVGQVLMVYVKSGFIEE